MGIKGLRKIQLGLESTSGTPVAATALWRGLGTIEDKIEPLFVEEDVGIIGGTDRTAIPQLLAEIEMEAVPATFEQLPYLGSAGIKNIVAGGADGAGTGKIYTYTAPTTAKNTIKTYTIEGGDDQQAEEMEYAFVEEMNLVGKAGEVLTMQALWKGRQVSLGSFTGAISVPIVEEILFSKGKLYIDAVGGTVGSTIQSQTLLGMDMKIVTGWMPVFSADGALYFSHHEMGVPEITCSLTFEHDAIGVARKADWRAETPRLFRLIFEGSAVATPGTTYTYKTLILDFAAKVEKVDKLDEVDGNDILNVQLRSKYNATSASFFEMLIVNELATLP